MAMRELRSRLHCDGDAGERLSCEVRRESDEEAELRSAKCDGARERGWAVTMRRREGEIETWECEDLREAETSEGWEWLRNEKWGFQKSDFERGRTTPYRREKKMLELFQNDAI